MEKKIFAVILVFFCTLPSIVWGGTLSASPALGEYGVGESFSVRVIASSADQAVNAISGNLTFPKDKLSVIKISKENSIVNLWVQEPQFSNYAGTVSFEGVILGNGFKASSGEAVSIIFKVLTPGTADIRFSSGLMLANDGSGSNLLTESKNASYQLIPDDVKDVEMPTKLTVFSGPQIESVTHPNQEAWYQSKEASLSWELPTATKSVLLGLDSSKNTQPGIVYDVPILSKRLTVPEGVWYFTALFKKADGSELKSQYVLRVDETAPSKLSIKNIPKDKLFSREKFALSAEDRASGVSHYDIVLDSADKIRKKAEAESVFQAPALHPGEHVLRVSVYDKAGNSLTKETFFSVEGFSAPTVESYSRVVRSGELITVIGRTQPHATVQAYLEGGSLGIISMSSKADDQGKFLIEWKPVNPYLEVGEYSLWLDALAEDAVYSQSTSKMPIVIERGARGFLGMSLVDLGLILAPMVFIVGFFIGGWMYLFRKIRHLKRAAKHDVRQMRSSVRGVLNKIRDDVSRQTVMIGKTKTKAQIISEEHAFAERMHAYLEEMEREIDRERDVVDRKF